ncbi:dTDP-4-dehydrorhamnose 3,5-epimerase [Herbidospora sp. NBRC 101105]|uniref:dTDP-4-dehydrorhamnose 3,5-epimerase n=1 Tax=Herbidospora sp. NBRC 101105 TaxID=3032195 RepID=UPI0024A267A5|nr:dTDP-4-dehydrorhamnose 3,5-epimerase [Herbidospora sp. NBRC 101105]GLX96102.1 dTDP-4-dehydrorhamnose 3,5-epimerase [Herbidospora sp. NBRC 101105]
MEELPIKGAYLYTPRLFRDDRGTFMESFRAAELAEATGHGLRLSQANTSVSARGVIRGIHYADVPPSQAKYVTCLSGRILDVIVDLRVGSPSFGQHVSVILDSEEFRSVYISEGLGHGFAALTDNATVFYLCSEPYAPARERGINPLDPELGIDWRVADPVLSEKDVQAPSMKQALDEGLLPDFETCTAFYGTLS